jgi:hypothetical protein
MVVADLAERLDGFNSNLQSPIANLHPILPFPPLPKRRESQTFSIPARVSVLNVFAHSSFCPLSPPHPISPEIGRI